LKTLGDRLGAAERTLSTLGRVALLYGRNGSLRAVRQGASYFVRRLAGLALPQTVFLAPTYRCQCRCTHCYADVRCRSQAGELPTGTNKAWIDQVRALGAVQLNITGGEPLLREDIVSLIAHAHRRGLMTRISTNGYLLTRDRVAELRRAGLNQCGIAIDDADEKAHDRMRGLPGLFTRAVEGFRFLHEYGIESRLMTFACHRNIPKGLQQIMDLAARLRVRTVHVNIPYASGGWARSFDELLSEDEMQSLRRLQRSSRSPVILLEFPTRQAECCATKKLILYVNPTGEVTPCPVIPFGIGNLQNEPMAAIWKRHVAALRMAYRGDCPMNKSAGRRALQTHAALTGVRPAGDGKTPVPASNCDGNRKS
jgi:MoaA/NifB/PqqE/SkfB family radical SAM enzyme